MFAREALDAVRQAQQRWTQEVLEKIQRRFPERQAEFSTSSGESVKAAYSPLDVAHLDYERDLGFPGEYPYTRGIQPNMYRGRTWTFRQYAGFGTAEESNQRYKYLLAEGQTGLSVAFDLPTQIGYDSDHPLAQGEVGRVGVAIDSLADMEVLFDGIPLDKVTTSMTINAPAAILLAMYVAVAEKQGVALDRLGGTIQNDVLKEYVARGTYIFPPGPSLRLVADTVAFCARNLPRWNSISISGYHIREAGATAVQEVAFTLAHAICYVEAVLRLGLEIDQFAPRISWIFNTHLNFFEEIAKYRALRRLWAQLMKGRFGAQDPQSWMLRTHTQTGGSVLTAQQPENNTVRSTVQALAAVLGGVQSMAVSCLDEALGLPTEEAERLALRTQQILAYEVGVTDTADPLAGSYYVEALTDGIERAAKDYLERIESLGGAVEAIRSGYIHKEIEDKAWLTQREIDSRQRLVVGVNCFQTSADCGGAAAQSVRQSQRTLAQAAEMQRMKLAELRRSRNDTEVRAALQGIRAAAMDDRAGLLPPILAAVRAYATLGEICGVLRDVFGESQGVRSF